jgi:hypothetical protein
MTAPWVASAGCPAHIRPALERWVNGQASLWRQPPSSDEVFDSFEHCVMRAKPRGHVGPRDRAGRAAPGGQKRRHRKVDPTKTITPIYNFGTRKLRPLNFYLLI